MSTRILGGSQRFHVGCKVLAKGGEGYQKGTIIKQWDEQHLPSDFLLTKQTQFLDEQITANADNNYSPLNIITLSNTRT